MAEANEWQTGKHGSHSTVAIDEEESALDAAMELQIISIRLPQSAVETLKAMTKCEGIFQLSLSYATGSLEH